VLVFKDMYYSQVVGWRLSREVPGDGGTF